MKETFKQHIKRIIHVRDNMKALEYTIRHDALIEKALHSSEPGTTREKLCDEEVIVSLTTYGRRLNDVAPTIESIMQGSVRPNRIVLWLGDNLKDEELPVILQRQQKRGLQVEYCKDVRSHKKLVPALNKYPEAIIITVDDDMIYPYDLVERLVREHKKHPKDIVANRVHRIRLSRQGRPLIYAHWEGGDNRTEASPLNFQTGVGGVLYPPHSLDAEVTNEEVFMSICKYADDVWFYAMALKAGSLIRKCPTHTPDGDDVSGNVAVQDTSLMRINTAKGHSANDDQFIAVFNRYGLWEVLKQAVVKNNSHNNKNE